QVTLVLDGVVVRNNTSTNGNGIQCSGVPNNNALTKLTLLRTIVKSNDQAGIYATNCDVTIDQVIVGPNNMAGGIVLNGPDPTTTNTLIHHNTNQSDAGGIAVSGSIARAILINDTIVENATAVGSGTVAGVRCASGTVMFNTLIFGNAGNPLEYSAT